MEWQYHNRCWRGEALRGEGNGCRLSLVLHKIVQTEESAIKTVVLVVMSRLKVSGTLQTVVVGINRLVMHMQRRQYHHRQIAGQQYKRRNMS